MPQCLEHLNPLSNIVSRRDSLTKDKFMIFSILNLCESVSIFLEHASKGVVSNDITGLNALDDVSKLCK